MDALLHRAATADSIDLVRYMVEHGVSPNTVSRIWMMPLCVAASNGNLDIVKYLLENNAFVHGNESLKVLTLRYTAMKGRLDIMAELVSQGASFSPSAEAEDNQLTPNAPAPDTSPATMVSMMIEHLREVRPHTEALGRYLKKMAGLSPTMPDIEAICESLVQRLETTLNLVKYKHIESDKMAQFELVTLEVWKWMLEYKEKSVAQQIRASMSYRGEIVAFHKAIDRFQASIDLKADGEKSLHSNWENDMQHSARPKLNEGE